jgi:hypothetical protein
MGMFGLFKKEEMDPFNTFQIIIETPLKNQPLPRNVPHSDFEGYDIDHYSAHVIAVTDSNEDGTTRQDILKACRQGEQLELIQDEENGLDPSVRVCRNTGEQIGYLTPGMSRTVIDNSLVGYRNTVFISELTGGTTGNPLLGVNIHIIFAHEDAPEKVMKDYIESLVTNPITTH